MFLNKATVYLYNKEDTEFTAQNVGNNFKGNYNKSFNFLLKLDLLTPKSIFFTICCFQKNREEKMKKE